MNGNSISTMWFRGQQTWCNHNIKGTRLWNASHDCQRCKCVASGEQPLMQVRYNQDLHWASSDWLLYHQHTHIPQFRATHSPSSRPTGKAYQNCGEPSQQPRNQTGLHESLAQKKLKAADSVDDSGPWPQKQKRSQMEAANGAALNEILDGGQQEFFQQGAHALGMED
jgi:hypothetical protein